VSRKFQVQGVTHHPGTNTLTKQVRNKQVCPRRWERRMPDSALSNRSAAGLVSARYALSELWAGTDPSREIGSELRSLGDDLNQEAADSWVSDEERGLRIRRYALRILQVSYVDSEIPFCAKVEA